MATRNLRERKRVGEWLSGGISVNQWFPEPCLLPPLLGVYKAPERFKGSDKACSKEIQFSNQVFHTNHGTLFPLDHSVELVFCGMFGANGSL